MISRDIASEVVRAATQAPALTLTGPRQSGKTTLCQMLFPEGAVIDEIQRSYRTLEAPDVRP